MTPSPASPFFQPLPPTAYRSPAHTDVPSPALVPFPSSAAPSPSTAPNGTKATNGFHPAPPKEADHDEALQFALAGVWSLYSKGSTWDELEQKREKWDTVTRMVSRA